MKISYTLTLRDAPMLFEFYTIGLSEKSQINFATYPLFHTMPSSEKELEERIWQWSVKEHNWFAVLLRQGKLMVGFGLIKRIGTKDVTDAIAIRDNNQGKGYGHILQKAMMEEVCKFGIKRMHTKIISDNIASIRVHEKCGFKITRELPGLYPDILKYLAEKDSIPVDRKVLEMVWEDK